MCLVKNLSQKGYTNLFKKIKLLCSRAPDYVTTFYLITMLLINDYKFEITSTVAIMFIIIMYTSSHAFRYCAKYTIFTVLSYMSATVFIPLMLWKPRDYRNGL